MVLGLSVWSLSHYTANYGQLWLIIASRGPWGVLTGANEVLNRFFGTPEFRIFYYYYLGCATNNPSTRDQKVLAMCLLEALDCTYRGKRGISRFVGTPRWRIFYWLVCATDNPSTRDQKVLAMCLLEALGSTYRGKWGISRFVGTPRWRIFLVGISHPQPQQQRPKGVGHVPPGGHGEHLQGQVRYQQFCWDSKMKNFLFSCYVPPTAPTRALFFPDFCSSRDIGLEKSREIPKISLFLRTYFPGIRNIVQKLPGFPDPEISWWRPQTWKLLKGLSVLALHQK